MQPMENAYLETKIMIKLKLKFQEIVNNLLFYKKIIIIFLIINSYNLFSQNNCKVNYTVIPTGGSFENNDDVKKSKISNRFQGVDEALKRLNYQLIIKNDQSYYHQINNLGLNEKVDKTAKNLAGTSEFLKKNRLEIIKIINFSQEVFYVKTKLNNDWNLINETKYINGYLCFKATQQKSLPLKKEKKYEVIAWYCPKLPFQNGPKEFGGLPGLILELQDGRITYLANKIDLSLNQEMTIKKVDKKIISEEEFNKIYEDRMKNLIDNLSKN